MAEENRYFWLKLNQDFFDSKRIKKLRRMAGGDTYTIIYLKMQLLALNNDGIITWTGLEENIADELALDLDEAADDIKVTLTYMLHCGLCETSDNVNFFLPYVVQNTGSEGSSAKRKREQRAREKALAGEKCDNVTRLSAQCPQMSAQRHGEKDKDKEEEGDIEKERKYAGARAREEKPVDNFSDVENSDEEDELSTSPFIGMGIHRILGRRGGRGRRGRDGRGGRAGGQGRRTSLSRRRDRTGCAAYIGQSDVGVIGLHGYAGFQRIRKARERLHNPQGRKDNIVRGDD